MEDYKISIIVPIYNAEKYIEQCVRSLMEQTLSERVEFLFINDCTPDASMDILRKVLSGYPWRKLHVQIIENEKNLGISETRKKALLFARGDYIGWCDSDDWAEKNMFECMLNATDSGRKDIVIADYYIEREDGDSHEYKHGSTNNIERIMQGLCLDKLFPYQLWETLIKRTLIVDAFNKIKSTMSGEDCYANMLVLRCVNDISYIQKTLYHHRILQSSLTQNILVSKQEWAAQTYNIKLVESLYENKECLREGLLRWKIYRKKTYVNQFESLRAFYLSFPEIDYEALKKNKMSFIKRLLLRACYSWYPSYWLLKHKYWKRNKLELFWD